MALAFRTPIDLRPDRSLRISHHMPIAMLGSCFTDNIGAMLEKDGFEVARNPMGPLYNPASICAMLERASSLQPYGEGDLEADDCGAWHCLDFASRYSDADAHALAERLNAEVREFCAFLSRAKVAIITLGTAYVYAHNRRGAIVGNCHKFPASDFTRTMLTVEETANWLRRIVSLLPTERIIYTVSPIRHVGDGLHGNQLSKATLLLAIDQVMQEESRLAYFPAYEIMLDDLRDYRFYAADMKHPSEVAIDYIYEQFGAAYFDRATAERAADCRKQWVRQAHRQK